MDLSLNREEIEDGSECYKHREEIKEKLNENLNDLKNTVRSINPNEFEHIQSIENSFSLTGSIKVNDLNILGTETKSFFLSNPDRYFTKSSKNLIEYHLRGPRYVVALDPQYSVLQTSMIIIEDIHDAFNNLINRNLDNENQFYQLAPILDYLKNGYITLFNAFIHKEKLGEFKLDDKDYQNKRKGLCKLVKISTITYYESLFNKVDLEALRNLIFLHSSELIQNIYVSIKRDFRNHSFSSKSLSRPEASHPLILLGYSYRLCNKFKNIDYVLGLPSGATELATLTHALYSKLQSNESKLILVPISFHSIKDIGQELKIDYSNFAKVLRQDIINPYGRLLAIDDNSATGRTMDTLKKILDKEFALMKRHFSVAESDLNRIDLKLKKKTNKKFASPELFRDSIHMLPVSTIIKPMFDLRELRENRLLYNHYRSKSSSDIQHKILYEVISDSIENRIEYSDIDYESESCINSFRGTFLSNFFPAPIVYNETLYSSVEHAYLKAKFAPNVFNGLDEIQIKKLKDVLIKKGENDLIRYKKNVDVNTDLQIMFDTIDLNPGILKRWSKLLKSWGLERTDWDGIRLKLMIDLVYLKFQKPHLASLLLDTKSKLLIEGNDWDDTFWGVCNERGKNYLGRILMNIREKLKQGEITVTNNI